MRSKKTLPPICGLLLCALFCQIVSAQTTVAQHGGQKLQTKQGSTVLLPGEISTSVTSPAALSFNVLDPNNTVPNRPCDGRLNQNCGWYKGFWIFGDGNYLKFEDNVATMDAASLNIGSYDYGFNGTYQPVVYLTEKYSNDDPPEAARSTLVVNRATPSGTTLETTKRLISKPQQRIDIDYNHLPRVKYPINFVLSYRKAENANSVLFYYNGLKNGADVSTIVPASVLDYTATEPTIYQTSAYGPVLSPDLKSSPAPGTAGTILEVLNSRFKSQLAYNVSAPNPVFIQNLSELRVFPVFKTVPASTFPDGNIPTKPTSFVAVLLGTKPISDNEEGYSILRTNAERLLGGDVPSSLRISPNSDLYIRDIQYLDMQLQSSHDPNSLTITDVRVMETGQYRVFFRMVICNKGQSPETNISLIFNDLTGGKYSARPDRLNGVDLDGIAQVWTGGTAGTPWKVNLPGYQISGVPDEYNPACKELFFTIDTDLDGVQRLYQQDPRAVEVCVDFSAGAGECSKNEPLPDSAYQDGGKYRPADPDEIKGDGNWMIWAILILVLIGVLWFWYSRKDD